MVIPESIRSFSLSWVTLPSFLPELVAVLGNDDVSVDHAGEELEGEATQGRDDADHSFGHEHVLEGGGGDALGQEVESEGQEVGFPLVVGALDHEHDRLVEGMVVAVVQAPGAQSCPRVRDVVRDQGGVLCNHIQKVSGRQRSSIRSTVGIKGTGEDICSEDVYLTSQMCLACFKF